jgi:hypothetical protein
MGNPKLEAKLTATDILTTIVQVVAAIGGAVMTIKTGNPAFLVGLGALAGGSKGSIGGEFAGYMLKLVKKGK